MNAIDVISTQLDRARDYVAIFGTCRAEHDLTLAFAKLARLVHPDKVEPALKTRAADVFDKLVQMREGALTALRAGRFGQPFPAGATPAQSVEFELRSGRHVYKCAPTAFARGSFSALYEGRHVDDASTPVIVKIAADPRLNVWLDREAKVLIPLQGKFCTPLLREWFMVPAPGGRAFRVNVTQKVEGMVSLAEVIACGPLDPRDAAWIFRRVLAQAMAARAIGVVHAAILPEHVLVHPVKHEPLHIGWSHAVKPGTVLTQIVAARRASYPPEVLGKKPVDTRADIYMAGMLMADLLGGNLKQLPAAVEAVVRGCIQPTLTRRADDAGRVLSDFTRTVRTAWGKTYRPLVLPGRNASH